MERLIAIRMNDGEPVQNVPRSIKEEGHQILKLVNNEDGTYNLIVKRLKINYLQNTKKGDKTWRQELVRMILKRKY